MLQNLQEFTLPDCAKPFTMFQYFGKRVSVLTVKLYDALAIIFEGK